MIQLNLSKDVFNSALYPYLLDYTHRFELYMGGAGSGKSYFIAQKLIIRACREKIRILVCRKTGRSIKESCFSLFQEILDTWKLTPYVKINQSDFKITFPSGAEVIFIGLDTETKLLSLNNISCIFVEEAYEVEKSFIDQLNLRMRGDAINQQMILAWNPISKNSWLYEFCENLPDNALYIHTTYRDNKFLPQSYIEAIEALKESNPSKYRVYGEGVWGVPEEGLVFTNWEEDYSILTAIDSSKLEHRVGLDIGYRDPTAIIDSLYDRQNNKIYIVNEFYKPGCQLDEIVSAIGAMRLNKSKIFCDAADPRAIDFFKSKGIPAYPCLKGQGSVQSRIAFLQNNKIILASRVPNVKMELENFSYIQKNGIWTQDTTHEYSHSLDALGYAYSDIYTKSKLKTLDKSILGL